jgi:hypothetical protein
LVARREDASRRDEILCALARIVGPGRGDSPLGVARWLKERELRGFAGLDATISENGERLAFELWVKGSTEASLARRIQRAFQAEQAKKKPASVTPPSPPLVWPLGMRQRKERDSDYKLPWLLADRGGSEKVFLECLGDSNLHSVSLTLSGEHVGFVPVLRPGTFVEVEWTRNPEVERIVTWGGNREAILAQPANRDVVSTMRASKDKTSPVAEFREALTQLAEYAVTEIEKVMPSDFEAWKSKVREFPLEIHYRWDRGRQEGVLRGTLLLDMERLWYLFKDGEGHSTPVR